jgi:hypothetical protein
MHHEAVYIVSGNGKSFGCEPLLRENKSEGCVSVQDIFQECAVDLTEAGGQQRGLEG